MNHEPPRDRLRLDLWSKETITIPDHIRAELNKWKADPASFFIITITTVPSDDPFTQVARLLRGTSGGDETIKWIRNRIGRIGLHELRTGLGRSQLRNGTDAEDEFLQRIQSEWDVDSKTLSGYACFGAKCASLSAALGGWGSMICWPPDISAAK